MSTPRWFSDWLETAEIPQDLLDATAGDFVRRTVKHGEYINSLLKLQRWATSRWPVLQGSAAIKSLWAAWLEESER